MKQDIWNDEYYFEDNDNFSQQKKTRKQTKRKWREVEHVKEKQRLKKEERFYDSDLY